MMLNMLLRMNTLFFSCFSDLNVSPVEEWRRDLHVWCEPECMTYLQSKPIAMPPPPMHLQQMEQVE